MAGEVSITRQELHRYLAKAPWPVAPIVAAQFAREGGAPEAVLKIIERLDNRIYMSESDFWDEFNKVARESSEVKVA